MGDSGLPLPSGLGTYNAFSTQPLVPSFAPTGIFGSNVSPGQFGQGLLGAAAGFIPSSSTTTTSGSGSSSATGTTTPNLSPIAQNFLNQLSGQYSNYLSSASNLAGYQGSQANQINANSNAAQTSIDQALAARGLAGSPVAAKAATMNTLNRVNQLNTLNQSIPLLQRQLQGQALQQGNQFFASIPYGQTSNQNQNYNQNQTSKTTSGGGLGSLLGGLAGVAGMFSDEDLKEGMKPMTGASSLKTLSKLQPKSFNWKENDEPGHGFSAQEVAKVLPKSVVKDDSGFHRLDMIQMIPHLVSAVNHLGKMNAKKAA